MTNIACSLLVLFIMAPGLNYERSFCRSIQFLAETRFAMRLYSERAADANDVVVRDGWVQEGPPSQTITAAYMVIENHTGTDISLRSASTEVAEVVELHKVELVDGIMKMHRVERIDIPNGGTAELKPGGYHLMVIGLKKKLKDGDKVTFTLQFSNDLRKVVTIPVKPRSAMVKEGPDD